MKNSIVKDTRILVYSFFFFSLILIFSTCTGSKKSEENKKDYFQIERRKLLKTKGDIKTVGDAIMQYVIYSGKAPDISDISELHNDNSPYFARLGNLTDGWGNKFLYQRDIDDDSTFYIASSGKDGDFEGWEQSGRYIIAEFKHYNKDIIFSNGGFVYTSN